MLTAKKLYGFDPDYAVSPGETLKEVMESLNMSQKELAIRTGLTVQSLNRIFKGDQPISYETANKLELATGVPARMWNNLEAQYREQLAKAKERKQLENDLDWLKTIPTQELIQRNSIEPQKDKVLLLRETLKFFGLSSVSAWKDIWAKPAVAARRSQCFETCPGPASAWIRLGEIQAYRIDCLPFDKNNFIRACKKDSLTDSQRPRRIYSRNNSALRRFRCCPSAGSGNEKSTLAWSNKMAVSVQGNDSAQSSRQDGGSVLVFFFSRSRATFFTTAKRTCISTMAAWMTLANTRQMSLQQIY